ncbi:MAG: CDP-alcohol phosphatidyltransferase family protein [Candidatus Hodarchaeota archaeon]
MSKDSTKRVKQKQLAKKFIDGPVQFLIKHNISPNALSYLGFFCSLGAAFLIALGFIHHFFWFAWLVPFLLFWAGAFDVFDGEVARRTNNITKSGAFLDSNLDRLSDAVVILGLIYGGFIHFLLGYIIMFLIIMISYIRARAENEGINMKGIGFMERAERLVFLLIALILETWIYYFSELATGKPWAIYNPFISSKPVTWFFLFFILGYTFLLILTVGHRLLYTFISLKNSNNNEE